MKSFKPILLNKNLDKKTAASRKEDATKGLKRYNAENLTVVEQHLFNYICEVAQGTS